MGHPDEIAAAVDHHAVRARFAQRHPVITYLFTPIPLLITLWIAYVAGLAGILSGFASYRDTTWAVQVARVLVHGVAYIPAVVLTLAIAWVAIRSHTRLVWWFSAAGLVALVSGMMMVSLTMPTTPGTGQLQVGLGFPPALSHWPQFLVPLALTAVFAMRAGAKGYQQPRHADRVLASPTGSRPYSDTLFWTRPIRSTCQCLHGYRRAARGLAENRVELLHGPHRARQAVPGLDADRYGSSRQRPLRPNATWHVKPQPPRDG